MRPVLHKYTRWLSGLRLAQTSPWPLVAVGLALIGAGLGWDLRRQYVESQQFEAQRLQDGAQLVAQAAVQRLAAASTLLTRLDTALTNNPVDAQALVTAISAFDAHLLAVLSLDAEGVVQASSRPELNGLDLSAAPAVQAARSDADVQARLHSSAAPSSLPNQARLVVRARRDANRTLIGISALVLAPDWFAPLAEVAGEGVLIRLSDATGADVYGATLPDERAALRAVAVVQSPWVAMDGPWQAGVARSRADLWARWSRQARFGLLLWLGVALIAVCAGVIATLRRNEFQRLRGLHRRLLQGADEGIVGVDQTGAIRFANPAFASACGLRPGDLLGRPLGELLHWEGAAQPLARVLAGEWPRHEGECLIADGPTRWRASISPTREGGVLVGALLAFVDPTAAPVAGPAQGPAERLYRTLFDLSPDGVLIVDLESEQVLSFNAAAHRQLGYSADAFARMRIREHEAHPAPLDTIRHLARVVAEGRVEFDTRYRHQDGTVRDVMVIAQTIDFAGRAALYWVVRDITERKRASNELSASEALTRALIERLPLPLLVFDGDRLALSNARYSEIGPAPAAGLSRSDWLASLGADAQAAGIFDALWQDLARAPQAQGELSLIIAGGQRSFDLHLARTDARTLVLLVDLTERRLAEQRLQEARALAERAQRARSEFLANMSHEIRTPMTTILGLAYLLQRSTLEPAQRDQVQKIDGGARALLAILDDLLDYAKLETGRIQIEQQDYSLRAVIDDIHALFANSADDKGLVFGIEVQAEVPPVLAGDPVRLRQVLLNLVGNAIKFTQRGRVDLQVRVQPGDPAQLELCVRDTGIGIAADQLALIFEPFYQGEGAASRRFGGTGLGLPISRWLIDLMGGQLDVDSLPGRGSVFRVRLPLVRGQAERVASPPSGVVPVGAARLREVSVLLVEDHPINRQVAREILRGEGARVTTAAEGAEAIERLRADPQGFDVVLMDLQMPVMDGFEATRQIRGALGLTRLPVIAMTANASAEDRALAQAAGMDDHLAKPVDVQTLVSTVWRHARPHSPPAAPPPALTALSEAAPVLALERALERLAGNRVLYAQMARMFVQEQRDTLIPLRAALARGARVDAERIAHALKGVAATLGAERLAEAAAALERRLRKPATEADQPLIERCDQALSEAVEALAEAADSMLPEEAHALAAEQFDANAFRAHLEPLMAALADSNMAALDHYAELRPLANDALQRCLEPVDDALARLDFGAALQACRLAEAWLDAHASEEAP